MMKPAPSGQQALGSLFRRKFPLTLLLASVLFFLVVSRLRSANNNGIVAPSDDAVEAGFDSPPASSDSDAHDAGIFQPWNDLEEKKKIEVKPLLKDLGIQVDVGGKQNSTEEVKGEVRNDKPQLTNLEAAPSPERNETEVITPQPGKSSNNTANDKDEDDEDYDLLLPGSTQDRHNVAGVHPAPFPKHQPPSHSPDNLGAHKGHAELHPAVDSGENSPKNDTLAEKKPDQARNGTAVSNDDSLKHADGLKNSTTPALKGDVAGFRNGTAGWEAEIKKEGAKLDHGRNGTVAGDNSSRNGTAAPTDSEDKDASTPDVQGAKNGTAQDAKEDDPTPGRNGTSPEDAGRPVNGTAKGAPGSKPELMKVVEGKATNSTSLLKGNGTQSLGEEPPNSTLGNSTEPQVDVEVQAPVAADEEDVLTGGNAQTIGDLEAEMELELGNAPKNSSEVKKAPTKKPVSPAFKAKNVTQPLDKAQKPKQVIAEDSENVTGESEGKNDQVVAGAKKNSTDTKKKTAKPAGFKYKNITDSATTTGDTKPLPAGFVAFPKLIWSYWHDGNPPAFVRDVMFGWKRFNPDYTITVITRDTIPQYINAPLPATFDNAIIPHQADWVRLAVLAEHGGFWLDASLVLTRSLEELRVRQRKEAAEAAGKAAEFNLTRTQAFQYYISGFTTDLEAPVMESWFIASVPGGTYVTAMIKEFDFAMSQYKVNDGYVEHLRMVYGDEEYEKKIRQHNNMEHYLIIHLCSTKVVAMDGVPPPMTEKAEDGPNRFLKENGWNDWESAAALRRNYTFPTPLAVKLRGGFRDSLIRQLRDGEEVEKGSVYARYIEGSEAIMMKKLNETSGKISGASLPVLGIRPSRPQEFERRKRKRQDVRRTLLSWIGGSMSSTVLLLEDMKDGIGVGDFGEAPWEVVGSKVAKPWFVDRADSKRRRRR
ncbi:hypothetical protein HDU96_009536 [Phlyctochytrium bullatum]|nr:hypothetical protein HDU96_009536 [Phlyctochytrium bullatum]